MSVDLTLFEVERGGLPVVEASLSASYGITGGIGTFEAPLGLSLGFTILGGLDVAIPLIDVDLYDLLAD
ncbi:hypothetical protein HYR99_03425 [Candidatus Poribacteria bacterium]|nr:hypothetical protein [Candidatus Poribacteria bacterium]